MEMLFQRMTKSLCKFNYGANDYEINMNKLSNNNKNNLFPRQQFRIDNENSDDKGNSDSKVVAGAATSNRTISRLILARSGRADSGHYICVANNKYGSDKMVTNLLVQGE